MERARESNLLKDVTGVSFKTRLPRATVTTLQIWNEKTGMPMAVFVVAGIRLLEDHLKGSPDITTAVREILNTS